MNTKKTSFLLTALLVVCSNDTWAGDATFIYPPCGERGQVVLAEVGGGAITEPSSTVWFPSGPAAKSSETPPDGDPSNTTKMSDDSQGLAVQVLPTAENTSPTLELRIADDARIGAHTMRFINSAGLTNSVSFDVVDQPVIAETTEPHDLPSNAQPVTFPSVIYGRIIKNNQLDYYSFEVDAGEELVFQVKSTGPNFDPQLSLFAPTGSWFDAGQIRRLSWNDEPVSHHLSRDPRLEYRFEQAGRYLLRIESMEASLGHKPGAETSVYMIAIRHPADDTQAVALAPGHWKRGLLPGRLRQLWDRTVATPDSTRAVEQQNGKGSESPQRENPGPATAVAAPRTVTLDDIPIAAEKADDNDSMEEAQEVRPPVIIEGVIDRPDDVDYYRFHAFKDEPLVFEIETPGKGPPLFNPRMGIRDMDGNEFLTNIYKRLVRNFTFYAKDIQPRTLYTFKLEGEYLIEMRDITSRNGDPNFQYRLLVRRQIPHVGTVWIPGDRVNLQQGGSHKLTVNMKQEEGYTGEIAISVENLPEGVHAWTASDHRPVIGINPDEGFKERFLTVRREATIILHAAADAPPTPSPRKVRFSWRSILDGKTSQPHAAGEKLFMVLAAE